jgi:hypothetical protein
MGITHNRAKARRVLETAFELACSGQALPAEWILRTEHISTSPSGTYVAALGTALLAKSTDGRTDALSIKARSGPSGYSIRGLGHSVLAPFTMEPHIDFDLTKTGPEPLNNQPFFGNDRMEASVVVDAGARAWWKALIEYLDDVNRLSEDEARLALAAFIRSRREAHAARQDVALPERVPTMPLAHLVDVSARFVSAKSEGGRRGQAFVAAALDLVFERVAASGRVNDPSRDYPGDVKVLNAEGVVLLSAEVRQKRVHEAGVRFFVRRVADVGGGRAIVAALANEQPQLPRTELESEAEHQGVIVTIFESPAEVLNALIHRSTLTVEEIAQLFPQRMLARLRELGVSEESQAEWAELFAQPT